MTGNATLDIINVVDHYPNEDEELRAMQQWRDTGGNAANTAKVLSAHQHRCDFSGVIALDASGEQIITTLREHNVGLEYISRLQGSSPESHITLNAQNGSRTIVHHRDLPELSAEAFYQIPVERYDWLHFEGRNGSELAKMMAYTRENIFDQPISLEIEKDRPGLEALIPQVELVMYPRSYAQQQGFQDAESFLRAQQEQHGKVWMSCTWAEQGAWAVDHLGELFHAPALAMEQVVDTVGAGDVFNAGLIHSLATGLLLEEALHYAVKLAGQKVQQRGLSGLLT